MHAVTEVIKENIPVGKHREIYLKNSTYLHPAINATNSSYGVSSIAAVQW